MTYVIGFTGPRAGCTPEQLEALEGLIRDAADDNVYLHGDCIGGDAEFDAIAKRLGYTRWKMPSTWDSTVAHTDAIQIAEPTRPYVRNRALVLRADVLIACVPTKEFIPHSGTWYTARYAMKIGKPVTLIYPDGSVEAKMPEEPNI